MSLLSSKRALMAQALQRLLLDSGSLVLFSVYFIFQTLLTHGYLSKVACTSLALFLKHQEQMHTWYPASSNFTRACSLQLVILFPVSRVLWKSTMTLLRSPLLTTSPSSRVVLLPEAVLDSFFSPAFSEAPPFSEALPFSEATPLSDIFPISGVLLLLWPLLSLFPSPRVSFISWWCVFFLFHPATCFFLPFLGQWELFFSPLEACSWSHTLAPLPCFFSLFPKVKMQGCTHLQPWQPAPCRDTPGSIPVPARGCGAAAAPAPPSWVPFPSPCTRAVAGAPHGTLEPHLLPFLPFFHPPVLIPPGPWHLTTPGLPAAFTPAPTPPITPPITPVMVWWGVGGVLLLLLTGPAPSGPCLACCPFSIGSTCFVQAWVGTCKLDPPCLPFRVAFGRHPFSKGTLLQGKSSLLQGWLKKHKFGRFWVWWLKWLQHAMAFPHVPQKKTCWHHKYEVIYVICLYVYIYIYIYLSLYLSIYLFVWIHSFTCVCGCVCLVLWVPFQPHVK